RSPCAPAAPALIASLLPCAACSSLICRPTYGGWLRSRHRWQARSCMDWPRGSSNWFTIATAGAILCGASRPRRPGWEGSGPGLGHWRVASDLNWRRLKFWRRLTAQALDPMTAPGALDSISDIQVEHGPHAVVQAWLLVGWMASRLGWRVQTGRVDPGAELVW